MTLPADFQFSQGSLQDYVDCPRRFQLRHVLHLAWPAIEAEPALDNERYLQWGSAFHRLIHQHLLGLPLEPLSGTLSDAHLARWWQNYLAHPPADLPPTRYPELALSAPLGSPSPADSGGHRLLAKYDLVAVDTGRRAVIVDWKTYRERPSRTWLAGRLQTRVYPYLLVRAGLDLNARQPLQPAQVEMIYWFAAFPAEPERFIYSAAQYGADDAYLTSLVEEIERWADAGRPAEDLPLTTNRRRCRTCVYRSLCRRGVSAGTFAEAEDEPEPGEELDISLDFEQIAEVAY